MDADIEHTALIGEDGRTWVIPLVDEEIKEKGVGRFVPNEVLADTSIGDRLTIGTKVFTRAHVALPELRRGMVRRAQIINPKDAGLLIAWMGIGVGQKVLETGHGSAGLAMHLANVMGNSGTLISVENRPEHAEVGRKNMDRAKGSLPEFPDWHLILGDVTKSETVEAVATVADPLDAIILDLPEPWDAIPGVAPLLRRGGRLACYCPVSSQLDRAWEAVEAAGLEVDWAGELMERLWKRASRGGVRPGNTPMGHTAFLLMAHRP